MLQIKHFLKINYLEIKESVINYQLILMSGL